VPLAAKLFDRHDVVMASARLPVCALSAARVHSADPPHRAGTSTAVTM